MDDALPCRIAMKCSVYVLHNCASRHRLLRNIWRLKRRGRAYRLNTLKRKGLSVMLRARSIIYDVNLESTSRRPLDTTDTNS